jgi:hypothetical protein
MIGKIAVRSYPATGSRQVRRTCPRCKKRRPAELVDYGPGGELVFFACGMVVDPRKRGGGYGCRA